jgi:hypothetical protein
MNDEVSAGMMTTFALLSLLVAGDTATPSRSAHETLVKQSVKQPVAQPQARPDANLVTDAPGATRARTLRQLHLARMVFADGASVGEAPSGGAAVSLRELRGARIVLADGDALLSAP